MFGKQDGQDQQFGDMSNISLPGQQPAMPSSQFATPTPPPSVPPIQDLGVPELPAQGTPDQPAWNAPAPTIGAPVNIDDLASLKHQALAQLTPLVGHLEQTPEEKFRTTMMMIQAADDQTLIKDAYAAAQAISDEKVRAQALLDVINEINYFSQKSQS